MSLLDAKICAHGHVGGKGCAYGCGSSKVPQSYKVACWDKSGGRPAYNALRFVDTRDAEVYAKDLYMRWMGLDRWEIHESNDEPNKVFWHGEMLDLIPARRLTLNGTFGRDRRYGFQALRTSLQKFSTANRFALIMRDGIMAFEFGAKDSQIDVVVDNRHGKQERVA